MKQYLVIIKPYLRFFGGIFDIKSAGIDV